MLKGILRDFDIWLIIITCLHTTYISRSFKMNDKVQLLEYHKIDNFGFASLGSFDHMPSQ